MKKTKRREFWVLMKNSKIMWDGENPYIFGCEKDAKDLQEYWGDAEVVKVRLMPIK